MSAAQQAASAPHRPAPRLLRGAVLCLLLLLGSLPVAPARAQTDPSLRLLRTARRVTLERYERQVPLDLGVFVAAVGGDFVVRTRREAYDEPIRSAQIGADGRTIRDLPDEMVNGWGGLEAFLEVTFRTASGRVAARHHLTFCPSGGERQRVSDAGPTASRYPQVPCQTHFPFTKGIIWGIDDHWAASVTSWEEGSTVRVRPGTYEVTVQIARAYASLLRVPAADRKVTLEAVVVDAPVYEPPPEKPGEPIPSEPEPLPMPGMSAMAEAAPQPGVPTTRRPTADVLPDLAALPAWMLETSREGARDYLGFAATPWNAGPAPFVIEGFRRPESDVMDAYQYFYDADGQVQGRAPIGSMGYHAGGGHDHWHFLQFAAFDLLDLEGNRVVRGLKQGFCIAPTDAVDLTIDGASMGHWNGFGSYCGGERSLWVREALAPGWGDTYYNVSGQSFDITRVPNGEYLVRVQVDPQRRIHQTTRDNDAALRKVTLGGKRRARTVVVEPWFGIDA